MNEICTWEKLKGKYKTTCGHNPSNYGRGWLYCPFCGNYVETSRVAYQKAYHEAHKEESKLYYKKYYLEHK